MFTLLVLLPILTAVAAFLIYKQVGKREFLKLDLVQFVYAFILSPLVFIWMKSFILFFAKNEVDFTLSQNDLFVVDTAFSVLFLFFYAFVVIHSLTKSFEVKKYRDPLYDIVTHVESFHLWISHSFLYFFGLLLIALISIMNVFVPVLVELSKVSFYIIITLGIFSGLLTFSAIWLSNFTEYKFLKLMKLIFAIFFASHILLYFVMSPGFHPHYFVYWFVFALFGSTVFASFFIEKSTRSQRFIERFHHKKNWKYGNFLTLLGEK